MMTERDSLREPRAKRDAMNRRWKSLQQERSSWVSHWQEISTYLLPRNGRFFTSDRNKGERRYNNIYDSTGTKALRVLGAGLMAGATSPARPWFRLNISDQDLAKYQPVKIWLDDVTRLMQKIFIKSNTYRALHMMYEELGSFGTAASIILPDYKNVIHNYTSTIGEYAIGVNYQGEVVTLFRELDKTVSELVGEFGYKNCSHHVKEAYDRGNLDQWVTIVHAIEPRADRDPNKRDAKNMPWRSVYYERACQEDIILRESGFRQFPAVVPRWSVVGGDIYGHSPGMEALGDVKQLQHEQYRKAQGIDYMTNPPLQVPTALQNRGVDRLPGGVTYVDQAGQGIKSAFDVNIDLQHLLMDIQDVRGRINSVFFADLFLMLAQAGAANTRMTATEVAERHEEKLLMLGPVMERLHNELLAPLINMTFDRVLEAGVLPTPPPELQGVDLSIEFISVLAQAQRAVGTNSVDRFVGNLGAIAQFKPDALDKFDADEWVDAYADMLGVDPRMIIASDKVATVRKARAEAQAAQAQSEAMLQQSQTAKNFAGSDTGGQNALTDITGGLMGYSSPSPSAV